MYPCQRFSEVLQGTSLLGPRARFDGAILGWTIISGTDFSNAKGLEKVIHQQNTTRGNDTIYKSSSSQARTLGSLSLQHSKLMTKCENLDLHTSAQVRHIFSKGGIDFFGQLQ